MGSIKELKYPKKSHRKKVILPKYSEGLAEFYGIMMGDGGINNLWQATISVNSNKDAQYARYISVLCNRLFGVLPAIRKRKHTNTLVLALASTAIVDFLVACGLPRGNKLKAGLRIPKWILDNPKYCKACVRGLVDTDGCIYVHKHIVSGHLYRNIGLCFTSRSLELIFQVRDIFAEFDVMPHISTEGCDVYIYQAKGVLRYLKVFGTSNQRISSVYEKWRDDRAV